MNKLSITIAEACEITGLSKASFYRLFKSGKLQRRKVGKRTLILMKDLTAYLDGLEDAPQLKLDAQ